MNELLNDRHPFEGGGGFTDACAEDLSRRSRIRSFTHDYVRIDDILSE